MKARTNLDRASAQVNDARLTIGAEELADLLGISRRHLYALLRAGRVPKARHLGRRALWVRDEIEEWVRAGMPEAQP